MNEESKKEFFELFEKGSGWLVRELHKVFGALRIGVGRVGKVDVVSVESFGQNVSRLNNLVLENRAELIALRGATEFLVQNVLTEEQKSKLKEYVEGRNERYATMLHEMVEKERQRAVREAATNKIAIARDMPPVSSAVLAAADGMLGKE